MRHCAHRNRSRRAGRGWRWLDSRQRGGYTEGRGVDTRRVSVQWLFLRNHDLTMCRGEGQSRTVLMGSEEGGWSANGEGGRTGDGGRHLWLLLQF